MAGSIPQSFIDEILTRVDIVDIIDSRVPLKTAGRGEFKACCPFHDEKTPSFTVSNSKQFYHCFGCGVHGSAIGFLMDYAHLSFVEAVEELAANAGVEVPYQQPQNIKTKPHDSDNLLVLLERANNFFKQQLRSGYKLGDQAIEYLKNRGLSGEIARNFEVGLATDSWDELVKTLGKDDRTLKNLEKVGLVNKRDNGGYYDRFRGRIMFPIHDFKGRVVAFGGRVLAQGEPKYLNSPETVLFHKGSELYGLFKAMSDIKKSGFALVVEGYMDVIALAQFGITNVVATLGTATTRAHLDRLFRYTQEIVFCFDGDKAGDRAAWRALENVMPVMMAGRQVKFLFLPQGYDPDSLVQEKGKQKFEGLIKKSMPLSEFLLSKFEKQTDLSNIEGRARLLFLAKPYFVKLREGPLKQLLIEQLARMARTDRATTYAQLSESTSKSWSSSFKGHNFHAGNIPGAMSIIAKAISLLVQNPQLNEARERIQSLQDLEIKGINILLDISGLIESNPALTTGVIIERYRDTPNHKALEKLASQHHLITDQSLVKREFEEILESLNNQLVDQKRNQLIKGVESGKMTDKEAANQLKSLHNKRLKNRDI